MFEPAVLYAVESVPVDANVMDRLVDEVAVWLQTVTPTYDSRSSAVTAAAGHLQPCRPGAWEVQIPDTHDGGTK
jgi:hypothetical protein